MPRIAAPTIAQNRDLRQSAILAAATEIARESGVNKITVGEIAKRAGIARTSVYAYFESSADLIADVLIDELFDMIDILERRVNQAPSAREAILAWMQASLEYVNDGRHEFVKSAATVDLPPARRAEMQQLHRTMIAPLTSALAQFGVENEMRVAMQISGIVDVAVRRLTNGGNLEEEIAAAEEFIMHGLSAH